MPRRFAELTFTDSVKAAQARYGTRAHGERYAASGAANVELGKREADFIAARDSFYMATVSESGWPYLQHRGGRPGFLKVLDPRTLAFADFRGNLQYQSTGNLAHDDRVCLILVDYPNRRRLKVLGRAQVDDLAAAPAPIIDRLSIGEAGGEVERVLRITVEAYDWNCRQHIAPRYNEHEVAALLAPWRQQVARLRARLRELGDEEKESKE